MSDLNDDFDVLAEQMNEKLKEAVAALKQVNVLRKKAGLDCLGYNPYVSETLTEEQAGELEEKHAKIAEAVDELLGEIDNAGWSTSSFFC